MRSLPGSSTRVAAAVTVFGLLAALGTSCSLPFTSPAAAPAPDQHEASAAAPTVTWSVADGATLSPGSDLHVQVAGGTLASFVVADKTDRLPVTLNGSEAHTAPLPPGRTLTATATTTGADGVTRTDVRTVETTAADLPLTATITPGDDATVGVGQPIIVTFNSRVIDHAAAERALSVSTDRPVGRAGWHWFSDTEVQYRPEHYWPAGTKVEVTARLRDVRTGARTWGVRDTTSSFTIGRAQILRIDDATHQMTVVRDDRPIRTVPVSLGQHEGTLRTRSGIKTIMAIERTVHMDSRTVGIDGSDAYNEDVPYAMRLTWSGEYVHGAPWSEWAQGKQDVSHGCTNVSLANGKWLFENSLVGDPVETVGTGRAMEPGNGWGGGWNLSWADWTAGSALR